MVAGLSLRDRAVALDWERGFDGDELADLWGGGFDPDPTARYRRYRLPRYSQLLGRFTEPGMRKALVARLEVAR